MNGLADQVEGAPHPSQTLRLFGQGAAETALTEAFRSGRAHHAWLLTGPRGVGKATLAYRAARWLIAGHEGPLDMAPDHPVFRRVQAGAEPGLATLRREINPTTGNLRAQIAVEDARKLKGFAALAAPDRGWRAVIVDAADDMNVSAANALLKLIEEPPARMAFLLVSHAPGRLLPTIRSRCRTLPLRSLSPEDLTAALAQAAPEADPASLRRLAPLAEGSAGEAMRLLSVGGAEAYGRIAARFSRLPGALDRAELFRLSDAMTGREAETAFEAETRLTGLFLARLARAGASGETPPEAAEGEAELLARLSPNPAAAAIWAQLGGDFAGRVEKTRGLNLDRGQMIFDTCLEIERAARKIL